MGSKASSAWLPVGDAGLLSFEDALYLAALLLLALRGLLPEDVRDSSKESSSMEKKAAKALASDAAMASATPAVKTVVGDWGSSSMESMFFLPASGAGAGKASSGFAPARSGDMADRGGDTDAALGGETTTARAGDTGAALGGDTTTARAGDITGLCGDISDRAALVGDAAGSCGETTGRGGDMTGGVDTGGGGEDTPRSTGLTLRDGGETLRTGGGPQARLAGSTREALSRMGGSTGEVLRNGRARGGDRCEGSFLMVIAAALLCTGCEFPFMWRFSAPSNMHRRCLTFTSG